MTLFVTEFSSIRNARSALDPVAAVPPLAEQTVAVGGTSAQSAVLNIATGIVRLHALANCCVSFGASPTATVASMRLAAGSTEYFSVTPNSSLKIAAIASA